MSVLVKKANFNLVRFSCFFPAGREKPFAGDAVQISNPVTAVNDGKGVAGFDFRQGVF